MSDWQGDKFFDKVNAHFIKCLKKACVNLSNQVKKNISEPPPASDPGEFPHRDTGELRRSVTWEVDENSQTGRVGTNKEYAARLETDLDRSFLRRTQVEELKTTERILHTPMKE